MTDYDKGFNDGFEVGYKAALKMFTGDLKDYADKIIDCYNLQEKENENSAR